MPEVHINTRTKLIQITHMHKIILHDTEPIAFTIHRRICLSW